MVGAGGSRVPGLANTVPISGDWQPASLVSILCEAAATPVVSLLFAVYSEQSELIQIGLHRRASTIISSVE